MAVILLTVIAGAQQERHVTGIVVSAETERPIANATVQYEARGTVHTTQTNSKGHFEFSGSELGVVTVASAGYGTARRRWPSLRGHTTLQIALVSPVTIEGNLTDRSTARPLGGAVTVFTRHQLNSVSAMALVEGGAFRFDDLPEGDVLVLARADDRAPSVTQLTTRKGDRRLVQIALGPDAKAEGRVQDALGRAVAGARVVATYDPSLPGAALLVGVVGGSPITDADGAFALNSLVPGNQVTIYAVKGDYKTDSVTIAATEGMVHDGLVLYLR